jgi:protein gp37
MTMAQQTEIEWTDVTWNPATGCTKISPGCDHCYAERFAERWRGIPGHPYEQGFALRLHEARLKQPLRMKKPSFVFVNSMSDLFHKEIPFAFVDRVFETMEAADWHVFQVLTKRSSRLQKYVNARYTERPVPRHIWLGVSIEGAQQVSRLAHLKAANALTRFLSIEPLISQLPPLNLEGIHWVIVGGESGPGARPMAKEWVRTIRDQCVAQDVAFFFKQWGGLRPKSGGRKLDGREWSQAPFRPVRRVDQAIIAAE